MITIGYPPFLGIFTGSGSSTNPQVQAQQQEQSNGFGDGFGGFGGFNGYGGSGTVQACYTSNANLAVPTSIAPVSSGTLVDGTVCGSPAAAAGITASSVITAINGQPAGSPAHLTSILARYRPGDTISVTWVSPTGQRKTSNIRLAAGPPQYPRTSPPTRLTDPPVTVPSPAANPVSPRGRAYAQIRGECCLYGAALVPVSSGGPGPASASRYRRRAPDRRPCPGSPAAP